MMSAQTVEEKDQAGNMRSKTLKSLFAIAENYPELKASQNFLMLQEELSGIENKIAYARQHYNDTVLEFNNLVTTLPGSLFAGMFGKKTRTYLEITAAEREVVKVLLVHMTPRPKYIIGGSYERYICAKERNDEGTDVSSSFNKRIQFCPYNSRRNSCSE